MSLTSYVLEGIGDYLSSKAYLTAHIVHAEVVEAPRSLPPYARGCFMTMRSVGTDTEFVLFSAERSIVRNCSLLVSTYDIPVAKGLLTRDTIDVTLR